MNQTRTHVWTICLVPMSCQASSDHLGVLWFIIFMKHRNDKGSQTINNNVIRFDENVLLFSCSDKFLLLKMFGKFKGKISK